MKREGCTAVLLPAGLVLGGAYLSFFSVANDLEPVCIDAVRYESLARSICTLFAERQIVLSRATLV